MNQLLERQSDIFKLVNNIKICCERTLRQEKELNLKNIAGLTPIGKVILEDRLSIVNQILKILATEY